MAAASSTRRTITLFTTATKGRKGSNITTTSAVMAMVLITTTMNMANRWWCWMGTMMGLARKVEEVMVAPVATPMGTECRMLKFKLPKLNLTTTY